MLLAMCVSIGRQFTIKRNGWSETRWRTELLD